MANEQRRSGYNQVMGVVLLLDVVVSRLAPSCSPEEGVQTNLTPLPRAVALFPSSSSCPEKGKKSVENRTDGAKTKTIPRPPLHHPSLLLIHEPASWRSLLPLFCLSRVHTVRGGGHLHQKGKNFSHDLFPGRPSSDFGIKYLSIPPSAPCLLTILHMLTNIPYIIRG